MASIFCIEKEDNLLYDGGRFETERGGRLMTCREAERLVMPYINGELTDAELAEFLKHIDTCEDCREELEIYFTCLLYTSRCV